MVPLKHLPSTIYMCIDWSMLRVSTLNFNFVPLYYGTVWFSMSIHSVHFCNLIRTSELAKMSVINLVFAYIPFFFSYALHFEPGTVDYCSAQRCLAPSQDATDIVELPPEDIIMTCFLFFFVFLQCIHWLGVIDRYMLIRSHPSSPLMFDM